MSPDSDLNNGNLPLPISAAARRGASQENARLILAGVLILLGVWVLRDFLNALGWAVILAIATWPLYERFIALMGERPSRRILTPFLFTLLIGLVFLVPIAFGGIEIGRELNELVLWAGEAQKTGIPVPDWLPQIPMMGNQAADWWRSNLTEPGSLTDLVGRANPGTIARVTQDIAIAVARGSTTFVFTILTLFFIFLNGVILQQRFRVLNDRVFGKTGSHLSNLIVSAVRSTADGLVLVGLGEGAVLGVAYSLFGVPHPALLGAFTGLLAMIPFGAPFIFSVAALLLLANGSAGLAIGMMAFGFLVVFIADHFIRPVLIGGAAKLPFLWVLLGIFGGLTAFGLLGLFLGPAIMAALVSLWREWTDPKVRPIE